MVKGSKKNGRWTLHIKNTENCHWSKMLSKYADFDTFEEVEKCGESFRKCSNCFRKEL